MYKPAKVTVLVLLYVRHVPSHYNKHHDRWSLNSPQNGRIYKGLVTSFPSCYLLYDNFW